MSVLLWVHSLIAVANASKDDASLMLNGASAPLTFESDLSKTGNSSCNAFHQLIKAEYLKSLPNSPTIVNVTVYLEKLYSINWNSDLHLVIYVEAKWYDQRVVDLIPQSLSHGAKRCLVPSYKFVDKAWYPAMNFHVSGDVQTEKLPNENTFLAMSTDGNMYYRGKYEMHTPCWVNLRMFPMDEAFCRIDITSLEYDPSLVNLRWAEGKHILTLLNRDTAEHHLVSIKDEHKLEEEVGIQIDHLVINLAFSRHVGWYLMHAYFPAYLIILISWLYTTLGLETRASRLQLRASLLLALVLMIYHILRQIPKVNYVKAIDVFMILVLGFLTLSCVEDTIVTWCCNRARRLENREVSTPTSTVSNKRPRRCSSAYTPQFNFITKVTKRKRNSKAVAYEDWSPVNGDSTTHLRVRPLPSPNGSNTLVTPLDIDQNHPKFSCSPSSATVGTDPQRYRKMAETIDFVFIFLYPCLFLGANIIYWYYYGGSLFRRS